MSKRKGNEMDATEQKHLAGLTASVERETQAVTERRAIIDDLRARMAKGSRARDARAIMEFRRVTPPACFVGCFENIEVERLFDAIVEKFRADLDRLAEELSQ